MITLVRRASWALAAPAAVAAVLTLAPAASGVTSTSSASAATRTLPAPGATGTLARGNTSAWRHKPAPRSCRAADLGVWVAIDQGSGAAGTIFYPLQFTNLSDHACTLRGFPRVAAVTRAGRRWGRAARRNPLYRVRTVYLRAGRSAHAILGYGDVVVGACAARHLHRAVELRVTPPRRHRATHALFGLDACTARGVVFMTVSAIERGPGRG